MTGRYPVRLGMQYSVLVPGEPWGLPLYEKVNVKRNKLACFGLGDRGRMLSSVPMIQVTWKT